MVQYQLKPQPADKRNVSQADILNNFTYLQASVGTDHNFTNLNPSATDGYHKIIHYVNQSGTLGNGTPAPIAGNGQLYTKTITTSVGAGEHLCYQQGTNATNATECCLTAAPIRAAVSFNTLGAILGTAFNVSNVTYAAATNSYTITFTTNPPSVTYLVLATKTSGTAQFVTTVTKNAGNCVVQFANNAGAINLTAGADVIVVGG